jgi:hypothetical protein
MFPQLWRIFTAFLITKPKFAILLDPYFLYQYGSGLERESSRFSQPGDFFTYTVFVGGVIVVSPCLHLHVHVHIASTHPSAINRLRSATSYIYPHSHVLLERFSKLRKNTLAHHAVPSFAINQRDCGVCRHGGIVT